MLQLPTKLPPYLILAFALAACGTSPAEPAGDLLTETTGTEFVLGEGSADVSFTVTNTDDEVTYYIAACGHWALAQLERREDGNWVNASSAKCLAVFSSVPLALGPHQQIESGVGVRHPGVYRLRLGVSRKRTQQSAWIETSNSFVVQ